VTFAIVARWSRSLAEESRLLPFLSKMSGISSRQVGLAVGFAQQDLVVPMKIATFNINNVRKRLANLLDWLRESEPDVVCLQELKATDREFPLEAIRNAGYSAAWRGERAWNGVAFLSRHGVPVVTRTELPGDPTDGQSRYLEAAVNGILIGCLYAPNGNPQPGPKFVYKLKWLERLAQHAATLYRAGVPVVLAGDYNVVPTDRDIYASTSWAKNALVQPESRAAFRKILDQGWIDAIRTLHPDEPMYTFWDYMRNRWERDAGLRLDHLLLNAEVADRLVDAGVDRAVRGKDNASDHAPAWIVLREAATRATKPARNRVPRKRIRARTRAKLAPAQTGSAHSRPDRPRGWAPSATIPSTARCRARRH
jgi:exodeoxyribonuclease III